MYMSKREGVTEPKEGGKKKKFGERGLSVWRDSEGKKTISCGLSEYRMSSSSQIPAENK